MVQVLTLVDGKMVAQSIAVIGATSGYSGFSGYSGATGVGTTGASGYSGVGVSGYSGISGAAGAPGRTLYLDPGVSTDLAGYQAALEQPSVLAQQTVVSNLTGTSNALVAEFVTYAGCPGVPLIPQGTGYVTLWAMTGDATQVAEYTLEIWSCAFDGTVPVERARGISAPFAGFLQAVQIQTAPMGGGSILPTDRLMFRLYATRISGPATCVLTNYFDGPYPASVQTTISAGAMGISGYSGKSGYSGASGYSGSAGTSGYSGLSGASGNVGFTGLTGQSGYSGAVGSLGQSGYSGAVGSTGTSGYSGGAGTSGFSGYSGGVGSAGASGYSGVGTSGYSGAVGSIGTSGYSGAGLSGFSGYSGIGGSGYSGISGYSGVGTSGYSGASGMSITLLGTVSTATALPGYPSSYGGLPGSSYITADTGHLWDWSGSTWVNIGNIVGPIGASGYSGLAGSSGYSGLTGASGYSGESGYSGVGTSGYSGASGYSGISGYSGTSGYSGVGLSGYSGTNGTSVTVLGTVTTSTSLPGWPSAYGGLAGSAYITSDTGHMWVWTGTAWTDVGNIVGPAGASGYSGHSGYSGLAGTSGFSGYSGIGASGFSGYSGTAGASGYSGIVGASGYSGLTGTNGVSGYSGVGTSGYSGVGLSGFSGYSGSGASGFSGYSGTGGTGASGYSGTQGTNGVSGYSGVGTSGYSGATGTNGTSGYSGTQGTNGTSGYSGIAGASGYSGAVGTSGFSGYSGARGISGYSGTNGTSVTILGSVTTSTSLPGWPSAYGGAAGSAYITSDTGHLWVWTGTTWTDAGNIVGPAGASGYSGVGTSGYSGAAGTAGTSGFSGYSGATGTNGTSGYSGTQGASGYSGATGTNGVSGYSGSVGTSGFSGYSGASGTAGTSGFSGYSGIAGTSGFSGYSGLTGTNGTSGYSGISGSNGTAGASGYSGLTGTNGTSGYSGIVGTSGYSGLTGTNGTSGYSGVGSAGTSGYSGVQGTSGYSGVNTASTGMLVPLAAPGGFPTSGAWTPGAVSITDTTWTTDAIAQLNGVLSLLVPAQPPNLSTFTTLSVASVGTSPLKASGSATDNTGGGTIPTSPNTAGNTVVVANVASRITAATPSTTVATNYGSGTTGILATAVNGVTTGNALATFTTAAAPTTSTVGAMVMTGRADFPSATPGFWRSFIAQAVMSGLAQGWNRVQIQHSISGNTNEFYMLRDNVTAVPAMAGTITFTEVGTPTYAYSSSVPHYGPTTAAINVAGVTMTNLAGETYYNGNPFTVSGTGSICTSQAKTYANVGVTTPIARQTVTATALTTQAINIDATNVHGSGTLQGVTTNVNGSSTIANLLSTIILVKRGTTTGIDETAITMTGLGSSPNALAAARIGGFANSDTPALSGAAAWVQSAALQTYDAAVVAGVLSRNVTNYSTGYLPVGPNLTGQAATQYVTFSFQRDSRSSFNIVVTGTYAGCWVALPGVSSVTSSTQWWTMYTAYSGAGFPGDIGGGNGSLGCASGSVMAGASGTYLCTFGTQSSTNSTGNNVYIRFKLTTGQSITALSFTN